MDSHPREPPSAYSPSERDRWDGRNGGGRDRDRSDSFHRARSPGMERPSRVRGERSRSPVAGDRYARASRDGRDEYSMRDRDDRRRPPPGPPNIDRYIPGQDTAATQPMVNPLPDPSKLAFQVGFSFFGEWWRKNEQIKEERERQRTGRRREPALRGQRESQEEREKEKAKIQVAYDKYKEDLQARMARQFVQEHKTEQWFQERYVPEVRDPLRAKLNEFRRGNYAQWEQDLESGVFDEFSLEGIPKSESNGAGGIIEKEEGETTATNEVLGVGDLLPQKGSDIRDEAAFQPTLLIKTIAPHVNRANLESFCKEHLGEGEGGFKWLSLSDPNPSKRYHRIGWVMLHPSGEGTDNKAEDADMKPEEGETGEAELRKPLVNATAEKALEAVNGKQVKDEVRGDFTCHVGVHVPPQAPRKKALWDLFSAPERIEKDLELASRLINKFEEDFGSDFNAILKIEERVDELKNQARLQPPITASGGGVKKEKKVKKERRSDIGLDEAMDEGEQDEGAYEEDEDDEEEEGTYDDEVDDEDLLVRKKQLDLMVEYLRRVFNFCFFCVFESDSVHELIRKCAGGHLRRPRNTLSSAGKAAARASALGEPFPGKNKPQREDAEEGESLSPEAERERKSFARNSTQSKAEQQLQRAFNWVRTFEDKILQILEPEAVDIRKLGGKPGEQALEEELQKYVKQEDEHKFRCRVPECTKLFKEDHFWRKHVEKRHGEWMEGVKKEIDLINTYVLDPAHIAPSRQDANSNGHFPPPNGHMQAGTPRGFNLQAFQGGFNMQAFQGQQMAFPPSAAGLGGSFTAPQGFFGGHQVQTPVGWMPGAPAGGDAMHGGAGPIRRGGGNYGHGSARSGPYDRKPRDQRWGRDTAGGGGDARSPPAGIVQGGMGGGRGGNLGRGGGRWGDGAQGGAPMEAVAGRSIKSYEDLDAVPGSGGGAAGGGGGGAGASMELNY